MAVRIDNLLIHHFLEQSARVVPGKCALVHGDVRANYEGLNGDANRVARWLIDHGLVPGDRVVLLLENCREYVAAYYGCLKAGAVAIPLNPDLKADGVVEVLRQTAPRAIIASSRSERTLAVLDLPPDIVPIRAIARPTLRLCSAQDMAEITAAGDASDPGIAINDGSLASIIFTSGTTGTPKGVMLSHRNIVANTRSIVSYLELTADDIQMVVLPFFYVMGKSLLNTHVAVGGSVVLNNAFAYPANVVQQMADERVTGFSGVPSTYAHLLHRSPLRDVRDRLGSLRYCSQAGGHMARRVKEELLRALPAHTRLYIMYGATEAAARLSYVEPDRLRDKIDSIGIPIPGVAMSVRSEEGDDLPPGQVGELVATGENIMLGYWRDPEATGKVLTHHGYHTGDTGYRDADGYFHVVGRKDQQLKVGGHRVSPQEIEDAIVATDMVVECAVLGVPDALVGHRLIAVAVPIDKATVARDILQRCSQALPRHKVPAEIRLAKALPKNSSGKIDRQACLGLL